MGLMNEPNELIILIYIVFFYSWAICKMHCKHTLKQAVFSKCHMRKMKAMRRQAH